MMGKICVLWFTVKYCLANLVFRLTRNKTSYLNNVCELDISDGIWLYLWLLWLLQRDANIKNCGGNFPDHRPRRITYSEKLTSTYAIAHEKVKKWFFTWKFHEILVILVSFSWIFIEIPGIQLMWISQETENRHQSMGPFFADVSSAMTLNNLPFLDFYFAWMQTYSANIFDTHFRILRFWFISFNAFIDWNNEWIIAQISIDHALTSETVYLIFFLQVETGEFD